MIKNLLCLFLYIFNGFITMCNLQKRLIRAAFWLLLQAMFVSDWKQTAQRLKLQKRLLTINTRIIIRWNIYRDNNFHSQRQVKSVSENPWLYFKPPVSRCLLFSKMNSRQENRSKLSFTARIITKYSLERFLSICSEKMSKGFLKFYKLIIKPDTRSDRSLSQILQTCIN